MAHPVNVVYPAVNGSDNYTFKTMNISFRPTFGDPDRPAVTIMWTSTKAPCKRARFGSTPRITLWQPDHFVPLVKMTIIEKDELPSCDSGPDSTSLTEQWVSLFDSTDSPQSPEDKCKFLPDLSTIKEEWPVKKMEYSTLEDDALIYIRTLPITRGRNHVIWKMTFHK